MQVEPRRHEGTKGGLNFVQSPLPPDVESAATQVIDAAYAVPVTLGPGLLESIYELCLCHELSRRCIPGESQVSVPIVYQGLKLDAGLRLDLLVARDIVVEIKAVEQLAPIHEAQLLTYLKLAGKRLGLLINFNVSRIRDGIKRIVL